MMETITVTPKTSSFSSPKVSKTKSQSNSSSALPNVGYGCEHVRQFLKGAKKQSRQQYEDAVKSINRRPNLVTQTQRTSLADGKPFVTLRPTFLCLQCPSVMSPEVRDQHFEAKAHAFSVESRNGCLYCQNCQDFVYDSELERIRVLRGAKRDIGDTTTVDEQRQVDANVNANSFFPSCRATGLRGLFNMGQTCFMSVILQSLIHNPFIRNFYLGEGHKPSECEKEHCTSCAMDEMFTEFHSTEKTEGYGLVNMLMGSWMAEQALAGYQQQDAHEYMQFILNSLHLENSSPDTPSTDCDCVIHKTFYGVLQSTVTCDKCRNVTTALDPVMDLSLDLRSQTKKRKANSDDPQNISAIHLQDCLSRFTSKEKLVAADYQCQNCNGTQQNATKQLSIKRLPPVLPIHLKRFEHNKSTSSKLDNKISFPLQLDLYPYTTKGKRNMRPANRSTASLPTMAPHQLLYELSSVVVHKGKMDSGHYVSYSREGKDWFLFDDNKVLSASEAEVLDAHAYLLFYMVSEVKL